MRARAIAVSVALLLLAGTTAGVAVADQGGRLADSSAARVATAPAGLDSLLPADQLAPTGPAQWYMPWLQGGAGSNYLGQGGWRSYMPFYGPFGPYPTPQTAAFFGATSSPIDPLTTLQLSNLLALQSGTGLNSFGTALLSRTGLASLANANLSQLQQLGVGTVGANAQGQVTFSLANGLNTFVVPQGQNPGSVTLGQIIGQVPQVQLGGMGGLNGFGGFGGFGGMGGFGGFGGFPFGFGMGVGNVTGTATGQ
jgi:hypothetical protein